MRQNRIVGSIYGGLLRFIPGLSDQEREEWRSAFVQAWRQDPRPRPLRAVSAVLDLISAFRKESSRQRLSSGRAPRQEKNVLTNFDFLGHDFRLALRALRRRPAFTATAVLTLGLGLGVNASIFTVFDAALIEPLPYQEPDRLVDVSSHWQDFDKTWVSKPEFLYYREHVESFQDVAIYATDGANLEVSAGSPERLAVGAVSPNLFSVLGVEPKLGRGFTLEESRGMQNVAILGYELWQRLGADVEVLGTTVRVDGREWSVVGVLPSGFRLPLDYRENVVREFFVPLPVDLGAPASELPQMGGSHSYYAMARLIPEATIKEAKAELDQMAKSNTVAGVYPESWGFRTVLTPVNDEVGGHIRPALVALLGAVTLVLLVACSNVAHLILVRGQERRGEIAVCAALGASRARLLRQLLFEAGLLVVAAGAVGLGLAGMSLEVLHTLDPGGVPRLGEATIDARVLGFMTLATVLTLLLSGLIPAFKGSRPDLRVDLTPGRRGGSRSGSRLRGLLVAVEIGLAVALLLGAGLLLRSLGNLLDIDSGLDYENVLTARLSLPSTDYSPEEAAAFWERLRVDAEGLPEVVAGGVGRSLPLADEIGDWGLAIEGWTSPDGTGAKGDWQVVTPGWLEALGVERIRGRLFEERDLVADPSVGVSGSLSDGHVVVINQTMARTYWPDQDPIGRRIQVGDENGPWSTVIGIVGDVRHNGLTGRVKEKFYRPVQQFQLDNVGWGPYSMVLALKTSGDPRRLVGPLESLVRELDPRVPLAQVRPLSDVGSRAIARERFVAQGLTAFSLLALLLAAIGVASIVAYTVRLRRREIGLRLALGATPHRVASQFVSDGFGWIALGGLSGMVSALVAARGLRSLLYGVSPFDPITLLLTPLLLVSVATLASWLPARAASKLDPMVVLREE